MEKTSKTIFFLTMILVYQLVLLSCNQKNTEEAKSSTSSSFEFSLEPPYDTINKVYNGLKQGKWVVKQNGKTETVYYKNDTLIK